MECPLQEKIFDALRRKFLLAAMTWSLADKILSAAKTHVKNFCLKRWRARCRKKYLTRYGENFCSWPWLGRWRIKFQVLPKPTLKIFVLNDGVYVKRKNIWRHRSSDLQHWSWKPPRRTACGFKYSGKPPCWARSEIQRSSQAQIGLFRLFCFPFLYKILILYRKEDFFMSRRRMSRGKSKRLFRGTADNTRAINVNPTVMRGGYRL